MSLGAAGDGAHVCIEHVVEVDPLQVEEGPARERGEIFIWESNQ